MNCYDCHPKSTPAIAVCVTCGKGLCADHCVRHDRTVVERVSAGMGTQERPTGRKVPRMMCQECGTGFGSQACPQAMRGR